MSGPRKATSGQAEFVSFDIDAPLPDPGTTVLLEASAGTGKTWVIAALVARHVIEAGVPLDRLLVVTFGRAASQELRSRVRERLVEAERLLEAAAVGSHHDPGQDALLARILRGDPDELLRRRERARRALTDFDSATIATIHQFCHLVLRSLGVAGDTDARAELVEDLEELREEVVDDLYTAWFATQDEPPVLTRTAAGALARRAVDDPQASLRPQDGSTEDGSLQHGIGTAAEVRVRFARAVREELQVRKRRQGILSYDDLLSRLADVLADPSSPARARMRERWEVVLVDEFQDTDPVQWEVFRRAFAGRAVSVLVGDPKQAIYAFRGGDIATYSRARNAADRLATLDVNHRSDAPLVDAVTALLRGARLGEGIEVREVRAAHPDGRLVGAPSDAPFRLRLVHRGQFGHPAKPPTIAPVRQAVADDLARDVAELLAASPAYDGRPLRAEDVAVLCSTTRQCEIVHRALAEASVPSVVLGAASVFASAGATDWLVLLEALEQPHRSQRVRAAALTCFLGLDAAAVASGGDDLTQQVAETMRDWAALLRDRGVAAVLEVAANRRDPSGHAMSARLLAERDGERRLTDVRHIGELLHELATREVLELPSLLTWLRQQIAETRRDAPEDRARRLDSDARAVQVLTIHKSKGLQYPVMYLPFASDHAARQEEMPLFHDDAGMRCLDVGGDPAPAHVRRAEEELSDEALRLLYVAMTRARSQLVTWWFASQRNLTASSLHRVLMGRRPGQQDVRRSEPAITDEIARQRAEAWQAAGGPVVELVRPGSAALEAPSPVPVPVHVRRWTRDLDDAWRRTSYTALAAAGAGAAESRFASEAEVTAREDEPELPAAAPADAVPALPSPMAGLPVGATFGSLVHAVLEHADPAAPKHDGDFLEELRQQIGQQRLRWPVDLDTDELARALLAVCRTPLGAGVGDATLLDIGVGDRMAELDFELPLAGGDRGRPGGPEVVLGDLAPLLRRHLPAGDPLLPYADTLAGPTFRRQPLRGYLSGSLDVVLRVDGRYLVVDYKTNHLGPWTDPPTPLTTAHYAPQLLADAMSHSSYPLQALLYAVVLHRFLRWRLAGYDPARHLGGVRYLYLRGMAGPDTPVLDGGRCGVFSWRPPTGLVEDLSDLLAGRRARR